LLKQMLYEIRNKINGGNINAWKYTT
jgi:hypothetical protein